MTEVVTSTAALVQLNLFANQRQVFSVSSNTQSDSTAVAPSGQAISGQSGFAQSVGQQNVSNASGQPTVGPSQPRVYLSPVDFGAATTASAGAPSAPPGQPAAAPPAPKQTAPEQDTSIPLPQNPLGVPANVTGPELEIVAANVIGAAFAPFQLPAGGTKAMPAQGQRSFIFEQHKLFGGVPFAPATTTTSATAVSSVRPVTDSKAQSPTDADQSGPNTTKAVSAYTTTGTAVRGSKPHVANAATGILA